MPRHPQSTEAQGILPAAVLPLQPLPPRSNYLGSFRWGGALTSRRSPWKQHENRFQKIPRAATKIPLAAMRPSAVR